MFLKSDHQGFIPQGADGERVYPSRYVSKPERTSGAPQPASWTPRQWGLGSGGTREASRVTQQGRSHTQPPRPPRPPPPPQGWHRPPPPSNLTSPVSQTAQRKELLLTGLCLLTFKCRTKQNKGCPRKQEELCCQPLPAAAADSLDAVLKAEMGGVGKWGGSFVPLELWRAE